MLTLSQAAILEKNKIASSNVWLILLEITIPATTAGQLPTVLRLVRNTEDIVWNSELWTAFPFELEPPKQSSNGELPNFTVRVSNITRTVEGYLEQAGGGVGSDVRIMVIMSEHLNIPTPELDEQFSVQSVSYDESWVSFTLTGAVNLFRRVPLRRFLKNFCPFQYKGPECKATSGYAECNKSLSDCRARNNQERFGGEPAIPQGGIYSLRGDIYAMRH